MVIIQRVCEIIAIDAPGFVSPPYAAGNTTVFNPSGVAKANRVNVKTNLSAPIKNSPKINIAGKRKSLRND